MNRKIFKEGRAFLFCLVLAIVPVLLGYSQSYVFADVIDDPAGALNPPQETVTSPADQRYTAEAFAALSDDEKKNVYFNTPQMLPENFSPEPYMNIFYPQP